MQGGQAKKICRSFVFIINIYPREVVLLIIVVVYFAFVVAFWWKPSIFIWWILLLIVAKLSHEGVFGGSFWQLILYTCPGSVWGAQVRFRDQVPSRTSSSVPGFRMLPPGANIRWVADR